jgi:hypothetical protein
MNFGSDSVKEVFLELPSKVREYFGDDTELEFRVSRDPECANDISIVAIVKTKKSVEDTLAALDSFDKNWWLDASLSMGSTISVNTEYF